MRNYLAIFQKEVKSYFVSPIAYVVIFLFILITGVFFYLYVGEFARMSQFATQQAFRFQGNAPNLNINMMALRPLLHTMSLFALFWLPLVTMRLYAEEKRSGTIELLKTSPVTEWQVILAKFSAALTVFVAMLALGFVLFSILFYYGNPELPPLLVGFLGLFLIGATYVSFGVFFSATTENQIVAAVETVAFILFFWAIGWLGNYLSPGVSKVISGLSLIDHFEDFAKGVLDLKHVIFYLSFIVMGLTLTYVTVESARWRGSE